MPESLALVSWDVIIHICKRFAEMNTKLHIYDLLHVMNLPHHLVYIWKWYMWITISYINNVCYTFKPAEFGLSEQNEQEIPFTICNKMPAREYYTKHLTSSLCNIPFPNISWDLIFKHAIYQPSQLNVNTQQKLT